MAQTLAPPAKEEPVPSSFLDAFSSADWLLLTGIALTWGSSFVFIDIGLEALAPATIALIRIVLGLGTLGCFRAARRPVERRDLTAIGLLGLLWMAVPFLLFPIAQQWIDSSLAGMINGSVPIFAGLIATVIARKAPPPKTIAGLLIGFAGLVVVAWPGVRDSDATALGVALVTLASLCYGIAINIAVPLQHKYGALPVLLRALVVAFAITILPGIVGATNSAFAWDSLGALIPIGCLGTGLAFVWMATLVGRVGAARGSVTIYFIPVVAIVLGAVFRDESIAIMSVVGTAFVVSGAYLTSRTQSDQPPKNPGRISGLSSK